MIVGYKPGCLEETADCVNKCPAHMYRENNVITDDNTVYNYKGGCLREVDCCGWIFGFPFYLFSTVATAPCLCAGLACKQIVLCTDPKAKDYNDLAVQYAEDTKDCMSELSRDIAFQLGVRTSKSNAQIEIERIQNEFLQNVRNLYPSAEDTPLLKKGDL